MIQLRIDKKCSSKYVCSVDETAIVTVAELKIRRYHKKKLPETYKRMHRYKHSTADGRATTLRYIPYAMLTFMI